MVLSSSAALLQNAIQDMAQARKYVWDDPYDEVARWESAALEAVREAFGEGSAELAELSAAIQDQAWKDTNRPDAVAPEVFVNNDFQKRMDRLEAMLKGYLQKLQGAQEQRQQAGAQEAAAVEHEAKVTAKKKVRQGARRKKKAGEAKRKAPAAKKKSGGRARTFAAAGTAKARKGRKKSGSKKKKGGKKRTAAR